MKKKTLLTARNYISLFFLSISLILVFKILFNMIAMGFIEKIWDLPSLEIYNDLQNQDFKYLYAHKVLAFCDQLGTFLIPSFLFFIIIKSITVNLSFEIKKDMVKVLLYFFILLGLAQLFLLISLKIGYDFLPVSAQDFLKNQQEFNSKLQEGFITNTLSGFLFNLLLLAIIPAIGEELFFRGILQNICVGLFRNRIVGVLITSLIFGLLHFQIENLLSIIFASILLGLVYEYSNNILITIILHFGFNSFSLCCMQALKSGYLNDNQLDLMGSYLFIPLGVTILVYVIVKKVFWEEELLLSID
jgi:membrane protease YdiL (CAAX protease family)